MARRRKAGGASAPPVDAQAQQMDSKPDAIASAMEASMVDPAPAPEADAAAYAPDPDLIEMGKDEETIFVHPNGLAEHIKLGWRVV